LFTGTNGLKMDKKTQVLRKFLPTQLALAGF
jgi:hypothetical protein